MRTSLLAASLTSALALGVAGCGDDDDPDPAVAGAAQDAVAPAPAPRVGDTVALTADGRLVSFDRATPATVVGSVALSGLAAGETLLGIDERAADGRLYGLGSAGHVYAIDPSTGAATRVSTLRPASSGSVPFTALSGERFGVDFNPAADRLRVVSDTGQNLRIDVDTGQTIVDGPVRATTPAATVTAAAYTNAFAGTARTQLFVLDLAAGALRLQDPPNDGVLAAAAPLGVVADASNGFDIDARTNAGYAAVTSGGATSLYRIDLSTGAASVVPGGPIAGGAPVAGLALRQPAAPSAVALTADNRLLAFDPAKPATIASTRPITGLASGERVVGLDQRPNGRQLYALTDAARLYVLDPATGAAVFKAALSADPADSSAPYAGLVGTAFSVDFNPVADRLRVIGGHGQNLRIDVDTGRTTTDGPVARAGTSPDVVAAAYGSNYAGARATVLYDLDAAADVLAVQNPPNDGTLVDRGPLGTDVATAAFDIAGGADGLALVAARAVEPASASGPATLFSIDPATGALTRYRGLSADAALIGGPSGDPVVDIALLY